MTDDDEIGYEPDLTYTPAIGGALGPPPPAVRFSVATLANPDYLRSQLDKILVYTRLLVEDLEHDLNNHSLSINSADGDQRLRAANDAEWPQEALGRPKEYVSYRYYRALETRTSRGAAYIRKRYEDALRDVGGTNALDLLPLVTSTFNEASFVKRFLDTYVGHLNDSSEHRTLELLQEWSEAALANTRSIRNVFETPISSRTLPEGEIVAITPEKASQSQAVFKHKLNELNDEIAQNLDTFKKSFSDYSGAYYNNFLGPALKMRHSVTTNITLSRGTPLLDKELMNASGHQDMRLRQLLADLIRRNQLYDTKTKEVRGQVEMRDTYRGYIQQLGTVSQKLISAVTRTQESIGEVSYFDSLPTDAATPSYGAYHSYLKDTENPAAHPQYLLRHGGEITGDVTLLPGIKVDGIVPHSHIHDGADGSSRIHGASIIGGTLSDAVVDTSDKPLTPENLELLGYTTKIIPSGVPLMDATIQWSGSSQYTYVVEMTRVT